MISFFSELNPILQSLIMGIITFLITTLGAATIFLFKNINDNLMTKFISVSAGIMIASSIFSLVVPALDYVDELKLGPIIISVSLLMGALLLFGISKINLNSSKKINSLISIHCNCCNKDICVKMSDVWKSDFHRCKSKEDLDIIKNKRKNKKEEYLKHRLNGSGLYFISFVENDPMSIKKPHVKLKCKSCGKTMIYSFSTITKNINRSPLKCKHCGFYSLTENEREFTYGHTFSNLYGS